jgi:arylsulfatase A-like enzyme
MPAIQKRPLLLCASLVLVGLLCARGQPSRAQSGPEGATQDRPNIVFIFSDDHAVQALGAYEDRLSHLDPTPAIDRLAAEGMLFRNAFVANSICAPSRATILSGQHSHINGVRTNGRGDSLAASVQTFPELLQDAEYQTAMIGKWHLKSDPQGFDYWEVLPGQGVYYNPTFLRASDTTQYTGYVSEIITDRAVRWLREGRSEEAPFLLMYQHKAPHRNWQPGPDHLTTYDDVTVPAPRTLFYDYTGLSAPAVMQEMEISTDLRWGWDLKLRVAPESGDSTAWQDRLTDRFTPEQRAAWAAAYGPKNEAFHEDYRTDNLQGRDLTRWKYQRYIKDYLRSIRSMDDQIGRLLDELDRQGLSDETIVVYASDQGFFLGEKGWFDKRWMYEESLQMPLLVRWPGVVDPGSESTALVQNLDLAQTFLDAAGVEAPGTMQGRSLTPLLRGNRPADWRESIYYHYYEYPAVHSVMRHEGIRTERYKLINHYWADQWALFDLEEDPRELNNVYGHPDYAEVTERLKRELQQLKTQYDVPAAATEAGPSQ